MAEAVHSTEQQNCVGFQLQLDRSNSKSRDMDRLSNSSSKPQKLLAIASMCSGVVVERYCCLTFLFHSFLVEGKEPETSFSHFTGLEALNPQKRELLEARFSAPRVRKNLIMILLKFFPDFRILASRKLFMNNV